MEEKVFTAALRRGLCCLVDWNKKAVSAIISPLCRGLCCLVDWNVSDCLYICCCQVEAYVASWIEIQHLYCHPRNIYVEAYVASWIEMQMMNIINLVTGSRLMLPRGLKCYNCRAINAALCRGLCCLVDWNSLTLIWKERKRCRGLCCLVDWNIRRVSLPYSIIVEAYVASWIEIYSTYFFRGHTASRLMLPRGLKLLDNRSLSCIHTVEAYVASWIEICRPCRPLWTCIVEAYVASWIEIIVTVLCISITSRGLCCLVDWNSLYKALRASFSCRGLCILIACLNICYGIEI